MSDLECVTKFEYVIKFLALPEETRNKIFTDLFEMCKKLQYFIYNLELPIPKLEYKVLKPRKKLR